MTVHHNDLMDEVRAHQETMLALANALGLLSKAERALETIAAGRDVDVNGEHTVRDAPLDAAAARNIARKALRDD